MLPVCPPRNSLNRYLLGEISDADAGLIDAHLSSCPKCRTSLDLLAVDDSLIRNEQQQSGKPLQHNPLVEHLHQSLNSLPENLTPGTWGSGCRRITSGVGHAANDLEELQSLLAPAQGPDELGRLREFRVLRVLGMGGMGVVMLAEDTTLGRQVALKLMRPALARTARARERFQREARMMARVQHDHVAQVFLVGEERGLAFLAMPLLQGETLETRLQREGRLPIGELLRIGREAALGLEAAHEKGLIHRDIKPANLWLEAPTGRVKILDFGLAREEKGGRASSATMVVGTPSCMPPEQINGQPEPRSDLFALGCVLYRAATGKPPFEADSLGGLLNQLLFHTPPSVRELNPQLPAPIAALIERLLAKEPADRSGSAREVAETLASLTAAEMAQVVPPAVAVPAARRQGRAWYAVALAAVQKLTGWKNEPSKVKLMGDGK
jgi:eukaryotic-like serine/threonine-protein kinase